MKRFMQKAAAAVAALILTAGVWSPAVYGLRVYDETAADYASFSAASQKRRTAQTEDTLIVKTDGTLPDFRTLHPLRTVQGPDDLYTVTFSSAEEASDKLSDVWAIRGVEYAEPNARVIAQGDAQPLTEYLTYGMELMHTDQFASDLALRVDLEPVVVAVVDSGVNAQNALFEGRLTEGTTMNGGAETTDDYGHGTSVAGVVADCTQGLPVSIMPVRVLNADGTGSLLDAANGIRYAADHDASIINISFVTENTCSRVLHDAVEYAYSQNVLPVVCAGNYAADLGKKSCCPADCKASFVVSGCDRETALYSGSCYGSTVDICAPAVDVTCISASGMAHAVRGTSFAAPHIAAVAAMYRLYMPDTDCATLERILTLNTQDLGDPGYDVRFGWGLPDLSALDALRPWESYRTVKRLELVRTPDKTTYYYKEPFSAEGLQARVLYTDGSEEMRSAQQVQFSGTESMKRGTNTIRVTCDGQTASFDVTVRYRWWQWLVRVLLFGWIWY